MRSTTIKPVAAAVLLIGWLSGCVGAGSNSPVEPLSPDQFPKVDGLNLLGEEIALPAGFEGEANLVSMGFVHRHQEDINTWIAALPEIQEAAPDLRFYEVPVIYEGNALFRWWLNNGMRIGVVEEEARRRTVTVYTDRDRFRDAIDLTNIEEIHTLLLDGDGRVVWRAPGRFEAAFKDPIVDLSNKLADDS